jgi:hypothetical protein
MILHSIEHLKDELKQINENTYIFKNNQYNLIKRDEDMYHFIRLDTITTHLEQTYSDKSLKDIREQIIHKLDYNLEFASDRTKLVDSLLADNTWIYNLVSTERFIKKEVKKKISFRSEEQPFDKLMEILSTYITHAKFIDEIDKNHYEALTINLKELESIDKRKRTESHEEELLSIADQIQSYHHKLIREELTGKLNTSKKVESTDNLVTRETKGDFVKSEEEIHRLKKITKKHKTDDLSSDYWDKMFSPNRKSLIPFYDKDIHNEELNKSILSKVIRKEMLDQLQKTVETVAKSIGLHLKNTEKRKEFVEKLIEEKGKKHYSSLRKMYNELKADYELAKKRLTVEIIPKKLEKSSTVIDINSDTWYTDEQGNEVFLSKSNILLSDANTYKGLILTYKDLKDKYYDKQDSDFWALLLTFEDLLGQTEFTSDEQFVLDMLFDSYTQTQIREKYNELNIGEMTTRRISNLINTTIPNKFRDTYLDSVEDWLFTEKIKGTYKTCSKCIEVKLASERHFGKDIRNKDKLKSSCKKCDNSTK